MYGDELPTETQRSFVFKQILCKAIIFLIL